MIDEKPSIEELIHYGKMGMKWGVRKNRIARLERVGAGKGSRKDNLITSLTDTTPNAVKRNKSFAGAAANKAANLRARDARIASGKGSVIDILAKYGGDRIIDTGKKDKSRR